VPLFPALRPYLEDAWALAGQPAGDTPVITRYRDRSSNLRTQLRRIIRKAGLTPWPRITHNLRASRATELAAEHPAHVAAAWLGHSTLVAHKHYWQVTDADFERATSGSEQSGAESGAREAQKAAQQAHAGFRGDSHAWNETLSEYTTCANSGEPLRFDAKEMAEMHGNRTHLPGGWRSAQRF